MKINTLDLRRLYQASIADKTPSSRKRCPEPAQIIALFNESLPMRRKFRLVKHLTQCSSCFHEFDSLRQIYHEQESLISDLAAWVTRREKQKAREHIEEVRDGYSPHKHSVRQGTLRPRFWAYILGLGTLALCLILAVNNRLVQKNTLDERYRTATISKIELIHPPLAGSVLRHALYFQWNPLPRAQRYYVELFDQELKPVWKSQVSTSSKIVLPQEIVEQLHLDQPYYWLVTGILADDKLAESDIGVFSLKGP